MKRKVQRRLRAATMFMLPVLSLSAQDKVEADIGAELVSDYVWRGQDLGNISVQPTASISYKGLWLSGWGTLGFDKDDTKEFDLTLGYGIKGFSISVTDYWFGDGAGYFHYAATNTSHVFEAQVGYDFDILAVNWFTNFAGCDGVNKQGKRAYSSYFSVTAPFRLGGLDWAFEVGAVPWATSFYNQSGDDDFGANGFEVSNISLAATKTLKITDTYSLPVWAKAIWNPATEGAHFVFGVKL